MVYVGEYTAASVCFDLFSQIEIILFMYCFYKVDDFKYSLFYGAVTVRRLITSIQ